MGQRIQRIIRSPETIHVPVSTGMKERLQADADADGWPVAGVARQAIETGLPKVRERERSRERRRSAVVDDRRDAR